MNNNSNYNPTGGGKRYNNNNKEVRIPLSRINTLHKYSGEGSFISMQNINELIKYPLYNLYAQDFTGKWIRLRFLGVTETEIVLERVFTSQRKNTNTNTNTSDSK